MWSEKECCILNNSWRSVDFTPTTIQTHWDLNKMADILQMIFSDALCWMKIIIFSLRFHWGLFLRVWLIIKHCRLFAPSHYLSQRWLSSWVKVAVASKTSPGIILCMHTANERWCYSVTPSLIGLAHTQNDPCLSRSDNIMPCCWLNKSMFIKACKKWH